MTDTPPGSPDQPEHGGPADRGRWPDRPDYGQPTMPRNRPQLDQPGFGQQRRLDEQPTQLGHIPPGYGQQEPAYGQQEQFGQYRGQHAQGQYEQGQYGQGQYGQGQYGQQPTQAAYQPPEYNQPGYGQPSYGQYGQQNQAGQTYRQAGWVTGAPAPGGIPLRPLSLGDILSGTFTLIRQNPAATVGLVALGTLAGAIITIILVFIANGLRTPGAAILAEIPAIIIDAAVGGGVLAALGKALLGRKLSIGDALQQSRLGWMILTGLGYWLMVGLIWIVPSLVLHGFGFLISFPLGAWLGIMLCLMFPVVVLERQNSLAAIGRSWQLVKGSFWRFFGIFALLIAVILVLFFIVGLIFTLVAGITIFSARGNGTVASGVAIGAVIAIGIFDFIVTSVLVALWSALVVLLYADVRMRKEGMDLALQQAAQNGQLTGDEFASYVPNQPAGGGDQGGGGYQAGGYPTDGGYQGGGSPGGYSGNPPAY